MVPFAGVYDLVFTVLATPTVLNSNCLGTSVTVERAARSAPGKILTKHCNNLHDGALSLRPTKTEVPR